MRELTGLRRFLLVGSLLAIVATACGGTNVSADPKGALTDAMKRMGDWEGVTATLGVDSDRASLLAAFEKEGLDDRKADLVLDSSLGVSWHYGDDPDAPDDDQASVSLRLGGVEAVAFRQLQEVLYVRVDFDFLVDLFADGDDETIAEFDAGVAEAEAFGLDFLADMRAGSWLKLTGMKQLQSMMEGMAGVPSTPDPSELEEINAQMREALKAFAEEDVEVTFVERDNHGDHLRATASGDDMLDLAEEVFAAMSGVLPQAPGLDTDQLFGKLRREAGADAEKFTVPFDLWISNGVISRMAFDVVALVEANPHLAEDEEEELPEDVTRLAIALDLSEFRGGVEEPSDAVEVDLFEIFGRLMGGAFTELEGELGGM